MSDQNTIFRNGRRNFLGSLGASAVALGAGIGGLSIPLAASANHVNAEDPDAWFNKIKGKHRVVFDATEPNGMMPFAWPKVFIMTNGMTGTPENECGVVVVLRHEAIPYAFNSQVWEKYKFGDLFKVNDPKTNLPSVRNPFWKPAAGDFSIPGIGQVQIGINELQDNGVMFCVCNMAMTVYSAVAAQQSGSSADAVKKEWMDGLLPGIQVVPSGVWAVGRAQEHKCAYIFAG